MKLFPKPAESVCAEADRIVDGDRQADYGHPIHDFTRIARMWEIILGVPQNSITPDRIPMCMIATKLSRQINRPKRDNLVDICGYAKTVEMVLAHTPT